LYFIYLAVNGKIIGNRHPESLNLMTYLSLISELI